MARQQVSIPILGIDTRPLQRQAVPGLCGDIRNLRPYGLPEEPYWEAVPEATALDIGTHNNIKTSYKITDNINNDDFVAALTDDHHLQIIGDELFDGSHVWVDKDLGVDPGDTTEVSFQQINTNLFASVSVNGVPWKTFVINTPPGFADQFIEVRFPDLPFVKVFADSTEESYTSTEVDEGNYEGLLEGRYWWRYAWRLKNGEHVMHSQPFPIEVYEVLDGGGPDTFYGRLIMFFEGYQQISQPSNIDFWKDFIAGVTVFLGEDRIISDGQAPSIPGQDAPKELLNMQFYEIGRFDFISENDIEAGDDRFIFFDGTNADIPAGPLMDVDNGSHHGTAGKHLFHYNSRLFFSDTSTDFWVPKVHPFNYHWYEQILTESDGSSLTITILMARGTTHDSANEFISALTVSGSPEISNINTTSTAKGVQITADYSATPYTITLDHDPDDGKPFSVTLNDDDIAFGDETVTNVVGTAGSLIYHSRYTEPAADTALIRLRYQIKTAEGEILQRESDQSYTVYPDTSVTGNPWRPFAGFLWYPDKRAFELKTLYSNDGGSSWDINDKIHGQVPDRINGSVFQPVNNTQITGPVLGSVSLDTDDNENRYHQRNRIVASEIDSPVYFRADRTYYVGSSGQAIVALAVNALPVSEGQYGQYPLFVFKEHEIWAMEQGTNPEVLFERISPISNTHGLSSRKSITNVGRSIVFGYKGEFYQLGSRGQPESISRPVEDLIDGKEPVAYFNDGDNKELWVALSDRTLVYNLEYGRWYALDRIFVDFPSQVGTLISLRNDGNFYDEEDTTQGDISTTINLEPIHFGEPDKRKRLFEVYFRAQYVTDTFQATLTYQDSGATVDTYANRYYLKPNRLSEYSWKADITGDMTPGSGHNFHKMDAQIELRLPHKLRRSNV
nr:hypothetical protein 6 [Balneolaceae bacterium]